MQCHSDVKQAVMWYFHSHTSHVVLPFPYQSCSASIPIPVMWYYIPIPVMWRLHSHTSHVALTSHVVLTFPYQSCGTYIPIHVYIPMPRLNLVLVNHLIPNQPPFNATDTITKSPSLPAIVSHYPLWLKVCCMEA